MQNYRVAILAAGIGSRLGSKAARSHKALLRVGEKAIISHIVDIFPEDVTFVIGVGHNSHLIHEYLDIVYPKREFIYVPCEYGPGYGPGYSLNKCRDHLQVPFFYFDCDTIIKNFDIDETGNWAACADIPCAETARYCTVHLNPDTQTITGFKDKLSSGTTLAWAGAAFVKDYARLWEALGSQSTPITGERQIAPALFSLTDVKAKRVRWFDTGNEASLAIAREAFETVGNLGRFDEEIFFHNGNVIKYYEDTSRLHQIISRMNSLHQVMPSVLMARKHFLKYRYTPGVDMSRVECLDEHIGAFLRCCDNILWKDVILSPSDLGSFRKRCLRFYRDKMTTRVADAFAKLDVVDRETIINGRVVPALGDIFRTRLDWDLISAGLPSSFHGDLNLSNVILTPQRGYVLVDCREEFDGDLQCGDRYYDLAKIYQSFLWPHGSVRGKAYEVVQRTSEEVMVSIDVPHGVVKARNLFDQWARAGGYDLYKIQVLSAMTLVNIAALHEVDLARHLLFYGWHCLSGFIDPIPTNATVATIPMLNNPPRPTTVKCPYV